MKNLRKILAMLLAVMLLLSIPVTAFAEDGDTAAETPETSSQNISLTGHTFTAYQIFTAETANAASGEVSNLYWGNGITTDGQKALTAKYGAEDASAVALALKINSTNAKAFAQDAFGYIVTDNGIPVTNGETTLAKGYYLIVDTTSGTVDAYNISVLEVSDSTTPITINSKVSVPSVDKEILDPTAVKTNEASIGDVVNYQITGTMPSNLEDYETYYYEFTDTLSGGLTYQYDLKVLVDGVDKTASFTVTAPETEPAAGTVTSISVKIANILPLGVKADSTIVVTYSAVLNDKAVIAGTGNPNTVKLTYSNNADKSSGGDSNPKGVTPESTVVTYTTELTILKTDNHDNILPGTEFTLSGEGVNKVIVTERTFEAAADGTYYKLKDGTYTTIAQTDSTADKYESNQTYKPVTVVTTKDAEGEAKKVVGIVKEDGKVTFTGLGAGTYTISETRPLPGYNAIEDITFTISFSADTAKFASNNKLITVGEDNKLGTTIVNTSGLTLPSTGGIGTTIFYVIGSILVIGAGVLLVTKKRVESKY